MGFFSIISIGLISIFWMFTTYNAFLTNGFSLFAHWFGLDPLTDLILKWLVWIGTSIYIPKITLKIIKKISGEYRYHFTLWLFWTIALSIPTIINYAVHWQLITLFLGVPAIGATYLLYWLKAFTIKTHKKFILLILSISIIGGIIVEFNATSTAEFENDHFEFEVNTYTIPTFLDWQIEAEIEIDNKLTNDSFEVDFSFGYGPCFDVCTEPKNDSMLYIVGTQSNSPLIWRINLNSHKIENHYIPDSLRNFNIIVKHDSSFELKEK